MWTKCGQIAILELFAAPIHCAQAFCKSSQTVGISSFHSFLNRHSHGHGSTDHRIVAHAPQVVFSLSTRCHSFPANSHDIKNFPHVSLPFFSCSFLLFFSFLLKNVDKMWTNFALHTHITNERPLGLSFVVFSSAYILNIGNGTSPFSASSPLNLGKATPLSAYPAPLNLGKATVSSCAFVPPKTGNST